MKTFALAFFVHIHPFGQKKLTQKQVLLSFMFQVFWCRLTTELNLGVISMFVQQATDLRLPGTINKFTGRSEIYNADVHYLYLLEHR